MLSDDGYVVLFWCGVVWVGVVGDMCGSGVVWCCAVCVLRLLYYAVKCDHTWYAVLGWSGLAGLSAIHFSF